MPTYEGTEVSDEVLQAIPAFFKLLEEKCGTSPKSGLETKMAIHCLNEVVVAASMGRSLMESNAELSEKYTTTVNNYAQEIDALNEKLHVLQSDLKHSERHRQTISTESDRAVEKLRQGKQQNEANMELRKREVSHLKAELTHAETQHKAQIEELELVQKQHMAKIERLESSLKLQQEKAQKDIVCGSQNTENAENAFEQLREEYQTVCTELERTNSDLEESLHIIERLQLTNQNASDNCETLAAEVLEKDEEIESMHSVISESRLQINQLQDKLNDTEGTCQTTNSKSMLSEIEDARAELERQLKAVTAKYAARRKVHEALKQQYMRLQETIAAALQLNANRANTAVVERLQQSLSQREGDVQSLKKKLVRAEAAQATQVYGNGLKEAFNMHKSNGDAYVSYLEAQLDVQSRLEKELRKELDMSELKLVSESNKVKDTQAALGREEHRATQLASDIVQLKLSISELKMKLDTRTTAESDDLIGRESDVECKERTTDDRMEDKENTVNGHQRKRRTLEITMETDDYAQSTKRQRHIDTELQPNNGKANRDNYEEVDQRAKGSTDGEDEVHDGVSSRGRDDGGGYQGNAIHRRMSVIKQPSPRSEMCNQQ